MLKSMYLLSNNFKCELMQRNCDTLKFLTQDIDALSYLYPEIKIWYWNTFAKGFARDERAVLLATDIYGKPAGFSLLKNSYSEKKICTFYIFPEYRESSLGKKLLPVAIGLLDEDEIGITVSESVNQSLQPLLSSNSFVIESIETGLYLPKQKEFIYKLA